MKAKLNNANEIRLVIGADYIVDIDVNEGWIYHDVKTPSGAIQLISKPNTPLKDVISKIEKAIENYEYNLDHS